MLLAPEANVRPALLIFLVHTACVVNCLLEYDFIVVGAGAGGGAVARRLVENGNFKVLLIESGGVPKPGHDIPVNAPNFLSDFDVTFRFQSIRQENAALRSNGTVSIVSGRMLGGTTSLNYMWFNRGSSLDWDNFAGVTGDSSWKYENMLKYFKRVETYQGDFPSNVHHGSDGPVTVSRPKFTPGLTYWLAAGKELGYPLGDPNGPQQRSFAPVEFAKRRGRRVSSYIGYLNPILDNPNFQILMNANVTEVIFRGRRAVGVRFISTSNTNLSGTSVNAVYATKEIIISAGTYNSPLILQRSGIGPSDVLTAAKIPIVTELPTGLNYQDHPAVNLNFIVKNVSYVVMDEDRDLTPEKWRFFNLYGDGPYSSTRGATGQAFMTSSVSAAEGNFDWPDLQLCMSHSTRPYLSADVLYMTAATNLSEGEVPMSSSIFLGRPKSRGSIKINPANVLGDPILDVGYLRDPRDVQIFLDGILETLTIFEKTNAYKPLKPRYAPVTLPGCEQFSVKSKEYWVCYIRHVIQGGCHPAGTNKMGKHGDPSAVVDNELRVLNVDGLRVVDASVMPFIVNANPHAAVYGIAEKAADLILKRWTRPPLLPQLRGYYPLNHNQNFNNNAKYSGNLLPVNNGYSYPFIPHYDHSSHYKGQGGHLYHHHHLGETYIDHRF